MRPPIPGHSTNFRRLLPSKLRLLGIPSIVALVVVCCLAVPAVAVPPWAPAPAAAIAPGARTVTQRAQCTSNFVFWDSRDVYLGQAAHCSSISPPEITDGCEGKSLPLGTPVKIEGASRPGTMVYNSWITMQESGEQDDNTCLYNDFALIRLAPEDAGKVNPSVPYWGGPTGLATGTADGERVLSYTNSKLRGRGLLNPVEGTSLGQDAGGWTHAVLIALPGLPGDSGSGFLNSRGEAFGTLSTLDILPRPLANGVSDLSRELDYMRAKSPYREVQLALGTEPFRGQEPNFLADLLRGILALL